MDKRGYEVNASWMDPQYRGKELGLCSMDINLMVAKAHECKTSLVYPEHNAKYLQECLENLKSKGINIEM